MASSSDEAFFVPAERRREFMMSMLGKKIISLSRGARPTGRFFNLFKAAFLGFLLFFGLTGCQSHPPKNLLWIVVDALRYDYLSCYGQKGISTPAIDSLAEKGALFSRAYCSYPATLPSITSMFTSTYPIYNGIKTNSQVLPDSLLTMAEILRGHGYQTAAVVSNFVLRKITNIGKGFEFYDDQLPQKEINRNIQEKDANLTAQAAIQWLVQNGKKKKFFLFVHFQDTHGPYYPHPELMNLLPKNRKGIQLEIGDKDQPDVIPSYQALENRKDVDYYLANYAGEVIYTDRQIQRLLAALQEIGAEEETVVIFTADHGEALGEHHMYFKHGQFLHEPQIRVPLIIKIPGASPVKIPRTVKHIDLGPTVLDLFGLKKPKQFQGKSVLPFIKSKSQGWEDLAFSQLAKDTNLALVNGPIKLVHFRGHKMFYDLDRDPGERKNIYTKGPKQAIGRLEQIMELYRNYAPKTPIVPKTLLDEKTKETLKTLGYIK